MARIPWGSLPTRVEPRGGEAPVNYEIGMMAGAIWRALNEHGPMNLSDLKSKLQATEPLYAWGIGWLAREKKLEISPSGATYRVGLHPDLR